MHCVRPLTTRSHSCFIQSNNDSVHVFLSGKFTREEVLGSQVADTQAEDGEFVQTGCDLLRERQQTGQPLQLPVQPVSVPFGRVGFAPFSWWLLHPDEHCKWRNRSQLNHQQSLSQRGSLNKFKMWPLFGFISFCQVFILELSTFWIKPHILRL